MDNLRLPKDISYFAAMDDFSSCHIRAQSQATASWRLAIEALRELLEDHMLWSYEQVIASISALTLLSRYSAHDVRCHVNDIIPIVYQTDSSLKDRASFISRRDQLIASVKRLFKEYEAHWNKFNAYEKGRRVLDNSDLFMCLVRKLKADPLFKIGGENAHLHYTSPSKIGDCLITEDMVRVVVRAYKGGWPGTLSAPTGQRRIVLDTKKVSI